MIVEGESRRAVANTADFGGALEASGAVYVGTLPDEIGLSNTAFEWEGRRWSMVLWPLPDDPPVRRALLLHEAWHRVQPQLGFDAPLVENGHLARESGRVWLRLEWRALRRALDSEDAARREAVADALLFRARRHALHPGAREDETALELNEGLAQYTGDRLGHGREVAVAAAAALDRAEQADAFARSFAYATGPAWGILLDDLAPGWRRQIGPGVGFGDLAAAALEAVWPPTEVEGAAEARAAEYGLAEVAAEESARADAHRRERERLLDTLVRRPALVLPLRQMQMQFDPNAVTPLPPHGSVYRRITIQDSWGEVEVSAGALLAADFTSLALPGTARLDGRNLTAEGWTLRLAEGWGVEREEEGGWRLAPPPSP